MNYRKVYLMIINHAKAQNRKKGTGIYYELHHILPKSLFPNWKNKQSNKVLLTAREHYFCHQLLTKIYPNDNLLYALWRLANDRQNNKCSSKEYERLKIIISQRMKNNNPCFSEGYKNRIKKIRIKTKEKKEAKFLKRQKELEKFKVICLNTLEVFDNTSEAGKWCNIQSSQIFQCCKKRKHYSTAGTHPITKEKLQWQFYDDYLKGEKPLENNKKRKIICVETDVVYESINEAARKMNIKSHSNICSCCRGERNICGGYHWRYI